MACTNPNHDHGQHVNVCNECGRKIHYDLRVNDYRHDDGSRCFLAGPPDSPCIPA